MDLAASVHVSYGYAKNQVMPALLDANRVHVTGWVRQHSGLPLAIYAIGPGVSVPMPGAVETATRMRKRRRELQQAYGVTDAWKVSQIRGAIVRDGKRLRMAGFGRMAGEVVR